MESLWEGGRLPSWLSARTLSCMLASSACVSAAPNPLDYQGPCSFTLSIPMYLPLSCPLAGSPPTLQGWYSSSGFQWGKGVRRSPGMLASLTVTGTPGSIFKIRLGSKWHAAPGWNLALSLDVCPLSSGTNEESKDPGGTLVLRHPESLWRGCGPAQLPFAERASRHGSDILQGNELLGAILL